MNEVREVVIVFSILWGAWAALAVWVMAGKPWPKRGEFVDSYSDGYAFGGYGAS